MSVEPHKPRVSLYPGGYGMRLVAMVGVLALIGATIYQMRNQALAARAAQKAQAPAAVEQTDEDPQAKWSETIVAGPGDDSPIEQEEAQRLFSVVSDKLGIGLHDVDMPAYWRMMKWALSRSFSDLEQRANRDVPFEKLFNSQEAPKHRGELIRLRIHVQRALVWDATENSMGVKKVYELWGGTDESRGNPYCVVCSELPPGIKIASETHGEIVFVGFFHKVLAYEVMGKTRGAPLLIGRVRVLQGGAQRAANLSNGLTMMLAIGAVIVVTLIIVVAMYRVTRRGRAGPLKPGPRLPSADVESWLENIPGDDESAQSTEPAGVHATNGKGGAHH